jgi:hypothetical protein
MSHLNYTFLFAAVLSGAIGLSGKRNATAHLYHTGYVFLSCILSVVAGGWIMFWIHG